MECFMTVTLAYLVQYQTHTLVYITIPDARGIQDYESIYSLCSQLNSLARPTTNDPHLAPVAGRLSHDPPQCRAVYLFHCSLST